MRKGPYKLTPKQMQAPGKAVANSVKIRTFKIVTLMALTVASSSALAAGDIVDIYKTEAWSWKFNSIMVEMHKKNRDFCGLASDYDGIEVDIRKAARDRRIFSVKESVTLTATDARHLEDFADSIALQKRDADRQCRR